jgi:hypothetical protein
VAIGAAVGTSDAQAFAACAPGIPSCVDVDDGGSPASAGAEEEASCHVTCDEHEPDPGEDLEARP